MSKLAFHTEIEKYKPLLESIIDRDDIVLIVDENNSIKYLSKMASEVLQRLFDRQFSLDEFVGSEKFKSRVGKYYKLKYKDLKLDEANYKVLKFQINKSSNDLSLYKVVADQSRDAIIITDANLEKPGPLIEYANKAYLELTGYNKEEIIGASPRIVQGEKTEREILDGLKNNLKNGEPFFGQTVNYRKDGTEFINEWAITPIKSSDGRVLKFMAVIRDVTVRENNKEKLIQSNTKLRSIIESTERSLVVYDQDFRIQTFNKKFAEKLFLDYKRIVKEGELLNDCFDKNAFDFIKNNTQKALCGKIIPSEGINFLFHDNLYYDYVFNPINSNKGVDSFILSFKNIDKERRAFHAVEQNEIKYRTIVDGLAEGIVLQDATGEIIEFNEAALDILGLTAEQLLGRNSYDPRWRAIDENGNDFPGEEHPISKSLNEGISVDQKIMGVHKPSGQLAWLSVNSRPIKNASGKVIQALATVNDVTEQYTLKKEAMESGQRYEALFQGNPIPMVVVEFSKNKGYIHDVNNALLAKYEFVRNEIIGTDINVFKQTKNINTAFKKIIESAIDHGKNYEIHRTHKGQSLIVEVSCHHLNFQEGNYQLLIFKDRTEDEFNRLQLKNSKQSYRNLFDKNPNPLFIVSKDVGKIIRVNDKVVEKYGYSFDDLGGKNFLDIFTVESRKDFKTVKDLFRSSLDVDFVHVSKNKETFYVNISNTIIEYDKKETYLFQIHDVTKRKLTEENLNQTTQILRLNQKVGKIGGWNLDLLTNELTWTEETYRIHEVDKLRQLEVSKAINFYYPSDRPIITDAVNNLINNGIEYDLELRLLLHNKKVKWVRTKGLRKVDNGKTVAIYGTFQDIDEIKKARQKEEEFANLYGLSNDLASVTNFDGKFEFLNPAWENTLGYSINYLTSKPFEYFIHPDDIQDTRNEFKELLSNKEHNTINFKNRYRVKTGGYQWLSWSSSADYDRKKLYSIAIDVTDQVNLEEELKTKERFFRKLILKGFSSSIIIDRKGKITYSSGSKSNCFGYEPEDLLGKPIKFLIHTSDQYKIKEDLSLSKSSIDVGIRDQIRIIGKNRKTYWSEIHISNQLEDPDVKGFVINLHDTTETVLAHKRVVESEHRYKMLVDKSPMPIVIHSKGIIRFINEAAAVTMGGKIEQFINTPILNYIASEVKEEILLRVNNIYNKKVSNTGVQNSIFLKRNGDRIFVELLGSAINFEGDEAVQLMFLDVSEKTKAATAIRESEYRYRSLVNNSPMPIIILTDDKISFLNYAAAKSLGGDLLDFLDKPINKFIGGSDKKGQLEKIKSKSTKRIRTTQMHEVIFKRRDGKLIYTEMLTGTVEYKGQSSLQLMFQDVTEKKELLKEQLKLKNIVTESFDEIYMFDSKTLKFKYANNAALANSGYTLEEIQKLTRYDLGRNDGRSHASLIKELEVVKKASEPVQFEGFNKRKDGSLYHALVKIQYMNLDGEEVFVSVVNDISEQYEANRRKDLINKINEAIVRRDASKDILSDLIGTIANTLDFELGEVWRYEDESHIRQAYYASNAPDVNKILDVNHEISFQLGEGIVGKCFKDKEVLWVNKFQKGKVKLHKLHIALGFQTVVAFPLVVDDEVLGVGKLYSRKKMKYDSDLTNLLLLLGGQLAQFKKRKNMEESLIKSLIEKEGLLQEIHHRVKNNLQTVSSLLYLRSTSITDPEIKRFFTESQSRINAITFTHERLLRAKSYTELDIKAYLDDLIGNIYQTHVSSQRNIKLTSDIESHVLQTDIVMNCGLIINEILTNAFDHAFGESEDGEITVSLKKVKGNFVLIVQDSGRGFDYANVYEDSVGVQLVHLFTEQLKGKMSVDASKGTRIEIKF